MIDLGTIRGVHEHAHTLHAHCGRCERWVQLDLEALIAAGQGDRRLPWTVRCTICGEPGILQLRPPMPDWTGVAGTWGGVSSAGARSKNRSRSRGTPGAESR